MHSPITTHDTAADAIRKLVAVEAIRRVLGLYCRLLDAGDFHGVSELFLDEGKWEAPYVSASGKQDIETVLRRINPDVTSGKVRKHIVADAIIDVDGIDATSKASYVVFVARDQRLVPVVTGTYEDHLIEDAAGWKFHSRRLVHDLAVNDLGLTL